MRFLFLAVLLVSTPVFAQDIYGPPPSSVGVAAPGQVPATSTNDNGCAGCIGAVLDTAATNTAMDGNAKDIGSFSLTAGDWDCSLQTYFSGNPATIATEISAGLNTTSATLPATNARAAWATSGTGITGLTMGVSTLPVRFSLASTTTIYMVARASFTVSTYNASSGNAHCRRVR